MKISSYIMECVKVRHYEWTYQPIKDMKIAFMQRFCINKFKESVNSSYFSYDGRLYSLRKLNQTSYYFCFRRHLFCCQSVLQNF